MNGPFRHTRSSTSIGKENSELVQVGETEVFVTPTSKKNKRKLSTPAKMTKTGDKKEKARTPSGQILTKSVGDIRAFFSPGEQGSALPIPPILLNSLGSLKVQESGVNNYECSSKLFDRTIVNSENAHNGVCGSVQNSQVDSSPPLIVKDKQFDYSDVCNQSAIGKVQRPKYTQAGFDVNGSASVNYIAVNNKQMTGGVVILDYKRSKNYNQGENMPDKSIQEDQDPLNRLLTPEYLQSISAGDSDPDKLEESKVMDVQLVMKMFQGIQAQLMVYKEQTGQEKIKEIEEQHQVQTDEITRLQTELKTYKSKQQLLTGVVQRMSSEMSELANRVMKLERANMRGNVVLTGLETKGTRRQCITDVEQFFQQELGVSCAVNDVSTMTTSTTPMAIISLADPQDKFRLLANAKKLKGLVNEDGKGFFLNEHLPAALNEERMRLRDIVMANNAQEERNQLEMSIKSGKLTIENKTYKKKVNPPSVEDILSLKDREMSMALAIKLTTGKPEVVDGNSFTRFTKAVNTYEEIRLAYYKMKLSYPEARHIICAYSIPGKEKHYVQDFCDDGDSGCGCSLFAAMKRSNLQNRVFFVTRHSSRNKIGSKCFAAVTKAAESALNKNLRNDYTNEEESFLILAGVDPNQTRQTQPQEPKKQRQYVMKVR